MLHDRAAMAGAGDGDAVRDADGVLDGVEAVADGDLCHPSGK